MNNAQLAGIRQWATAHADDCPEGLSDDELRAAVMGYVSYNGEDHWRLAASQWTTLYLLGDGFGAGVTAEYAAQQLQWDWSHVRDSSPHALRAMWATICRWHNSCRLRTGR